MIRETEGGVTTPKGFRAAGVHCGVKADAELLDLGVLCSDVPATVAGVFTQNRVKGAPVLLSQQRVAKGTARAVVANSGNANVCTGLEGEAHAREMADRTAGILGLDPEDVLVASTGVIGRPLPIDAIRAGIDAAAGKLASDRESANDFARAILTTDIGPKEVAAVFPFGKGMATMAGAIKGAGMIAPNMATMLCFVTTDAAVAPAPLRDALRAAAGRTLNRITVDGQMSTSDTALVFANGQCGQRAVETAGGQDFDRLVEALTYVLDRLGEMLVAGAEGVTRTAAVFVQDAPSDDEAERVARAIGESLLVKTAIHGGDPNWGRIVSAAGACGAAFDPARARVWIGPHEVFAAGRPTDLPEATLAAAMRETQVAIRVSMGAGTGRYTLLTCDLSKEYVTINADYTT